MKNLETQTRISEASLFNRISSIKDKIEEMNNLAKETLFKKI